VDKPDQFAGARGTSSGVCGLGAGGGVDGGLVVEAVQIATGLLEFPNPFMRLKMMRFSLELKTGCQKKQRNKTHLRDHHVAVKGAPALGLRRPANMRADLGDNGGSEGDVGDKVTVHDIDMEPVGPLGHLGRAFLAKGSEISAEDGGGYDRGGTHYDGDQIAMNVGKIRKELRGSGV